MGWWKIGGSNGRISECFPTGHPGDDSVPINAVPGRDAPDDNYNGDGPADVMGSAIKAVDDLYREEWGRPARHEEMRACFNFCFNVWRRRNGKAPAATAPASEDEG